MVMVVFAFRSYFQEILSMNWPKLNDYLLEVAEVQCEQMVDES